MGRQVSIPRRIAEEIHEDARLTMLRKRYIEGGGSPTDFITDLASAIDVGVGRYLDFCVDEAE